VRYGGRADDPVTSVSRMLLDEATFRAAVALGLQLRLAYTLCGGAFSLLRSASLTRESGRLILRITPGCADLRVELVERRLDALARSIELLADIRIG
jgi:exopolyphosphatase/guanosine-5'-triphosphate,3'-diphosphate pyrophosphatase